MSTVIIVLVALLGSALTLISGFGLGTLLLPVFALFFPVEIAVAMTAVVHMLNNVFKFGLLYKHVDKTVLLYFGVPGILGAFLGAMALKQLVSLHQMYIGSFAFSPLKAGVGLLMVFFALTELFPKLLQFNFKKKFLVPGGAISGFFGGISGHQGALRSMFLIKAGMPKEVYIATGVAIALLVDFTRIPVYLSSFNTAALRAELLTIVLATLAAFLGAIIGKKLIPKITLRSVHIVVGVFMIGMGLAMIFNVI